MPASNEPCLMEGHARLKRLAHAAFGREVLRKVNDIILPLNDQGEGPAIYCVHSVTGAATDFGRIAAMLGPNQPFFGIQTPTRYRNDRFPSSIESISQRYLARLTEFQPKGSFVLAGHSVGAAIALEMAQQLRTIGREVSLLVVFDGELFNTGACISSLNPLYWLKLMFNIPKWGREALPHFTFRSFTGRVWRKFAAAWKANKARLCGAEITIGHAVEGFIPIEYCAPDHAGFIKKLYQIQFKYVPKAYDGRVLVYVAKTQPLLHYPQIEASWLKIAPHAEIVLVDGSHSTIIRDDKGTATVESLKQKMAEIRSRGPIAFGPHGMDRTLNKGEIGSPRGQD